MVFVKVSINCLANGPRPEAGGEGFQGATGDRRCMASRPAPAGRNPQKPMTFGRSPDPQTTCKFLLGLNKF